MIIFLMGLALFALGILFGYLSRSRKRGLQQKSFENWPNGDPGDIRSYTPGPGPKPRSKGPADYVDGHEM